MPEIGPPDFAREQRKKSPGEDANELAGMLVPLAKTIGLELNHEAVATVIGDVMRWLRTKWKP